jgi:hypothetical protein
MMRWGDMKSTYRGKKNAYKILVEKTSKKDATWETKT